MAVYPAYSGTFDTHAQVKPETQARTSVRNADGTLATAPTATKSGGDPQAGTLTVNTVAQLLTFASRRNGTKDVVQLENSSASAVALYFGPKSTVTATGATIGHKLNPGDVAQYEIGNNDVKLYFITASSSATLVWSVI